MAVFRILWILAFLAAFVAFWATGIGHLAVHLLVLKLSDNGSDHPRLGLETYTLSAPPVTIGDVKANLSGLTFSLETGTLLSTINRPPEIIEFTTTGVLIRRIPVVGLRDLEGITHVDASRFILVDEAENALHWVNITPDTTQVDVKDSPFLKLERSPFKNMGFEALSWHGASNSLWVGQEMWPLRITKISGLDTDALVTGPRISVTSWGPKLLVKGSLMDLSSLTVSEQTGNIILLSDLTSAVFEFAPDGTPVGFLPLWSGYSGLSDNVPQAEGVALSSDGDLYIISEPNLFYLFRQSQE